MDSDSTAGGEVSVEKSATAASGRTDVELVVRSTASEPAVVRVGDPVPAEMGVVDADGATAPRGGRLVWTLPLDPGAETTVAYALDGEAATLPAPTVERVVALPDAERLPTDAAGHWRGREGTRPLVPGPEGREPVPDTEAFVVVGIPAYEAADSIGGVVREAARYADLVVVVDDGSPDDTADRAREAGAVIVSHAVNRGYGGALRTLFAEAAARGATHLVTLDADGQHDPADVPRLVAASVETGAEVVVGNRYDSGTEMPRVRAAGLALVNVLTNLSMGNLRPATWVRDTQSGYRAYSREAVASLATAPRIGDGMWASTDILYHAADEGFDVAEVPTTIRYDVANGSTQGAFEHGLGLLRNILDEAGRDYPLATIGTPGVASALGGVALGRRGGALRRLGGVVFLFVGLALSALALARHAVRER